MEHKLHLVLSYAESGHCDRSVDDHVDARARDRLQQTVHAARHQHHDQEAGEAEAGRLLVHGPARRAGLAVNHVLVPGGQLRPVSRQPVQLQGVADRGQPARPDLLQRLHHPQQSLVLARRFHATRLRRLSEVSDRRDKNPKPPPTTNAIAPTAAKR